jgi:hypothetical protein
MQFKVVALLLSAAALGSAQMTKEQKVADFLQLASTYAINYGPLQWKRDALHVDALNISDWLTQAANSADDLAFYEVCVAYVASLNDGHDAFELPSDFEAILGFTTDIYDGKVFIDTISRRRLSATKYPFAVGDELVSIDGTAAMDLVQSFTKYSVAANPVTTQRFAAYALTVRIQTLMPHAHQIGDNATVVINQQNGGLQTYTIPWVKLGTPLTLIGPVLSPFLPHAEQGSTRDYMAPLRRLRNMKMPAQKALAGFGSVAPLFTLPATFKIRMGANSFDSFYSGTFSAQGLNIGYIRIPDFEFDFSDDLENELAYMQKNTDGLIVDVMRNPGGDLCVAENYAAHLIPTPFRTVGLEIRATRNWLLGFSQALQDAEDEGAPDDVIQQLQNLLQQVNNAYTTPSGRTPPLPVCTSSLQVEPATDRRGNNIAYTKPIMLLTDQMTWSAAEFFAAVMQDNQRAMTFGTRTVGAGGNVNDYQVTTYSFATATVTESLMSRKTPMQVDNFPSSPYVENVGVRPDVAQEYNTVDNLNNHGATFVQAFSDAIVNYINSQK